MRIRPLSDWAVIKRIDARRFSGKIIIPDSAREKPSEGVIEAIGPGAFVSQEGKGNKEHFIPTTLKPGQMVFFTDYMARVVKIGDIEVTLVRERDILGTFDPAEETALRKPLSDLPEKEKKSKGKKKKESARKKTKPSAIKAERTKGAGKNKTGTLKGPAEKGKKPFARSAASAKKTRSRAAGNINKKVVAKKVLSQKPGASGQRAKKI